MHKIREVLVKRLQKIYFNFSLEIYLFQLVFLNIFITKASFLIPSKDSYFSIHYFTLL